jgi:hypothetical protein
LITIERVTLGITSPLSRRHVCVLCVSSLHGCVEHNQGIEADALVCSSAAADFTIWGCSPIDVA